MYQLEAGDVVFVEATSMSLSRRLIKFVSRGKSTVHTSIASGDGTFVYESVTSGLRRHALNTDDNYTVYRNSSADARQLICSIAEGFVANTNYVGNNYGSYSRGSAAWTGIRRAHGGESAQWGAKTSSSFYCSNFVARVLIAAKQSGCANVYANSQNQGIHINEHMLPIHLKSFLSQDPHWYETT